MKSQYSLKSADGQFCLRAKPSNTPRFHEDEIEIWLQSQNDNMCLFKDSVRYVLKTECNAVFHHVSDSSNNTPIYPPELIQKIVNKDFDPTDTNSHLLFEEKELSTFLTYQQSDDVCLIVFRDCVFEPKYQLSVVFNRNDFRVWFNSLLKDEENVK